MTQAEDRELVERFQSGEEGAFNLLVRKYQTRVFQLVYGFVGIHEEAQDLSQEIFLRAYQKLKEFRGESSFFTWLYRIAVNVSLNTVRKARLRKFLSLENAGLTISNPAPLPDQLMEERETTRKLQRAIQKLPNKQKTVFLLRYYHQLPHAEIAQILNRDLGTIKANYHQAIKKLKKAVNG
ncbi:MAG: RNA polymerase sigma factor [bacterium]